MKIEIYKEEICNLSRLPIRMDTNPCYLTAKHLIDSGLDESNNAYKASPLYAHYKSYNPLTLFDMYGVVEKMKNYSFDCTFLPWIHTSPLTKYSDIAFIDRTDEFICNQFQKIKDLIESIQASGFKPELFPDRKGGSITGFFLKNGDDRRFYVVSGNHRAAILSAMFPSQSMPAAYEKKAFAKPRDLSNRPHNRFLETYDFDNVDEWPSVKSNFLSDAEAIKISEVYFNE